ncbi:MAG TPA: DNA-binding response regulator [Microscillaceae bacterium]|nr:DNA-binding response regulator [Microscillaceae bacterium]
MKLLIVEDNATQASTLGAMAEEMNFQVAAITDSSTEALRLVKAIHPDLILMDTYTEGGIDGIEIAEKIKNKIPVIFISSMQEDEIFERAKKTQPFAYLNKPVDRQTLQRTIQLATYQQTQNQRKNFKWIDDTTLYARIGYQIQKFLISSIYYIQVNQKQVKLGFEDRQLDAKITFKTIHEKLASRNFIKVHRSFIVNIQKIEKVDLANNLIQMGSYKIPISRRNKKNLLTILAGDPIVH